MKKVLKAILIILLVAAAAGGAALLFYHQIVGKRNAYVEISKSYVDSGSAQFNDDILIVNSYAEQDRFVDLINTQKILDDITFTLTEYLANGTPRKFNDYDICKKLETVVSLRNSITAMQEEYVIKAKNSTLETFNRQTGADDIFNKSASYLSQYSYMLNALLNELDRLGVQKTYDAKFPVIELYLSVVSKSYTDKDDFTNLKFMNQHVYISNGNLTTNDHSTDESAFMYFYSHCNKEDFALRVAEYSGAADKMSTNSELVTAWYFNKVLGV